MSNQKRIFLFSMSLFMNSKMGNAGVERSPDPSVVVFNDVPFEGGAVFV